MLSLNGRGFPRDIVDNGPNDNRLIVGISREKTCCTERFWPKYIETRIFLTRPLLQKTRETSIRSSVTAGSDIDRLNSFYYTFFILEHGIIFSRTAPPCSILSISSLLQWWDLLPIRRNYCETVELPAFGTRGEPSCPCCVFWSWIINLFVRSRARACFTFLWWCRCRNRSCCVPSCVDVYTNPPDVHCTGSYIAFRENVG